MPSHPPMPTVKLTEGTEVYKKCVLLKQENSIYMPIGKVASASIKNSLTVGYTVVTKDEIIRNYMGFTKIAVTRNPFDRMVSIFCYFDKKRGYDLNIDLSSFENFVKAVYDMPDEVSNLHYRSQINLLSQDGIFLPDVVIDYNDIEMIKRYLPIEKLIWDERTKSDRGNYQDYYTPKLIDLVSRRFAADLRKFHYAY